tara:strand:- start:2434 stop:2658 length:225 start_codon:yes stop_codon:yes gene_type:complete
MEITISVGTSTANWLELQFHNNETGVTYFVHPPQIRRNYTNRWVAQTSGGYTLFFDNGDEVVRYMNDNNFTRIN